MATEVVSSIPIQDDAGSYTGEYIKILEGLEAVRLRPDPLLGELTHPGLHDLGPGPAGQDLAGLGDLP